MSQDCIRSPIFRSCGRCSPSTLTSKKKRIQREDWKEKLKSLFAVYMIIYIENPKGSTNT